MSEGTQPEGRLGATVVTLALQMLGAYPFAVMSLYAHRMQQHFSLTEGGLGFLLGCPAMGALVSLPLVGPATARLGPRRLLQVSLAGTGAAMTCMGLGHDLAVFQAAMVALGFFAAALTVVCSTFLINLYPRLRRRMLTVSLVSLSVPSILFPLAVQRLLAMTDAGRLDFPTALHAPLLIFGLALLALQFALSVVARGLGDRDPGERFEVKVLLSRPALLVVLLAALHAGSDNALWQWLPKYMDSSFERLVIGTGTVLALTAAVYVVSRTGLAALPEGVGQRALLVLPGIVGGALLIAAIWLGGPLMIGLGYPLAALFFALEYPTLLAEVRASSPTHFSTIYGSALWVSSLATGLQVNLIGQIGQRTGDLRIGLTVAALGFVAFGLIALASGLGRTRAA